MHLAYLLSPGTALADWRMAFVDQSPSWSPSWSTWSTFSASRSPLPDGRPSWRPPTRGLWTRTITSCAWARVSPSSWTSTWPRGRIRGAAVGCKWKKSLSHASLDRDVFPNGERKYFNVFATVLHNWLSYITLLYVGHTGKCQWCGRDHIVWEPSLLLLSQILSFTINFFLLTSGQALVSTAVGYDANFSWRRAEKVHSRGGDINEVGRAWHLRGGKMAGKWKIDKNILTCVLHFYCHLHKLNLGGFECSFNSRSYPTKQRDIILTSIEAYYPPGDATKVTYIGT